MKNLKRLFVLLFALVLVIPFGVFAEDEDNDDTEETAVTATETKYSKYKHTNLVKTLEAEGIELQNKDYEENDKQVTIYMFRGQGCPHCQEFLEFLNDLSKEEGYKFKLVAFLTTFGGYKEPENDELMSNVAEQLGVQAQGVPFIIIGDQSFPGYASAYDDQIKSAIDTLYDTPVDQRYDIFENIKEPKNHDLAVGIITVLVLGGLVATAVVTRKNNG